MDTPRNDFNHIKWKNQFEIASKKGDGFRELRADIFQNTIKIVKNGVWGLVFENAHLIVTNILFSFSIIFQSKIIG